MTRSKNKVQLYLSINIRLHRTEKGLSQGALAALLGVSPQAVSKWENQMSCLDLLLLPKIAEQFGITIDELLLNDISYNN